MVDLATAKKDAAARSSESKNLIFVDINGDGLCTVANKQSGSSIHAFEGGNEVPLPALMEVSKNEKPAKEKVSTASTKSKNKKQMEGTETAAATPAKKTAKKAAKKPAKKAAKKAAPAKKEKSTNGLIGRATTLMLSKGDWAKVDKAVADGKGSIRELASKGILKVV